MTVKTIAAAVAALAVLTATQAHAENGAWEGVAGASLATTSGNSSSTNLLLNLDLAMTTPQDKTSVNAYINEGKSKSNGVTSTTSGKAGLGGQYDYNISDSFFGFGKLSFERDRVIDLTLRTSIATGVGLHVIQEPETTFDVLGGVGYTDARYHVVQTIGGETDKRFNSVGLFLGEESTHKLSDTVFAKQRLEYYPGLTGVKAQLLKFNASLSVAMTKSTALTVGLVDTYNSKVAAGQKKNDLTLTTGVSMTLGQ